MKSNQYFEGQVDEALQELQGEGKNKKEGKDAIHRRL